MKIRFWGTRGSIPTPGPLTVRYGGNTACVEVRDSTGSLLILDAGTGLRELGTALMNGGGTRPFSVDLLLSHLHWDHIQGIPFFRPAYDSKSSLRIRGPKQSRTMRELLGLATGADTLIHDAQFLESDFKPTWGHSTITSAIEVAAKSNVKRLVLYHHDPDRTDDALDRIAVEAQKKASATASNLEVVVAR